MIALTSGDAAVDLRELAQDVRDNGWDHYDREHVARLLEGAATCWELGEPVLVTGGSPSAPARLMLVRGGGDLS
ncbi:hypothetical protein [Aeromicrobium fastidiosum]|uniref:Uncharacterized protein n=1 Tax=Aeromicrobium fastidiosum TaxID=52699 RepID=A0A641AS64_9ACTN|nr:hypothetical protein [Aeromicrobium fastidiosum]KAA1380512.1 hypothetical protein ESP62_004870 [Aeromicrobium fastidiosum]MBP2390102.1 hypothetical protein [Aeromicrobium fastidiosum]